MKISNMLKYLIRILLATMNTEVRHDTAHHPNMESLYIIFKIVNNKLSNYTTDPFSYLTMNIFTPVP